MATLATYKEHRGASIDVERIEVVYDFAVDGGASGTYDVLKLKEASVVELAQIRVITAVVGTLSSMSLGKSGDAAGLVASTAEASLTAGVVVFTNTIDSASMKMAADDVIQLSITGGDLTAGKVCIVLEVSKFL